LLTGAGIRTLGDLQRADVDGLRAVIGDWAAGLQGRSRGIDESVVAERGRPKSVSRETTFMQDQTDPERLRGAIEHFADRVASSLRHERLAARTVDVKLRITGFLTYTAGETLDHPTQDQRIIAETGQRLLKKLRRRHPQPVRLIGLGVSNLQEAADQLSLFTKDAERHVRLAAALDSVRDRFGFDALRPATHLRSLHPHDD
jgi:DNA polymerase-4